MALRARLPLLAATSTALLLASVLAGAGGAAADTAPPSSSTPTTAAADALPTVQINGVVWAQLIVGNTVYVGGQFTKARPAGSAAGVNEVTRNNLLAYNLSTGVMTSFNPNMNAQVRALAVSADGTQVFAGGSYTTVGGVSRSRLAAFSTSSGALLPWAPTVNGPVKALGVSSSAVYAGGTFSSASGSSRTNIAAFSTGSGSLQPWKGSASGGSVNALVVSPDGAKVVIGGAFTSYNGGTNPGYGMAATDAATGASLPWKVNGLVRNAGTNGSILSLTGSSAGVFGAGYDYGDGANFEGAFRASWTDGTVIWLEDCHGDTYSVVPSSSVVYTTGHPHFCGNIGGFPETNPRSYHRTATFTMNATGTISRNTTGSSYYNFEGNPRPTLLHYYPEINTGTYTGQSQGPWHVTTNSQYVLYGGEFTIVNNKRQQGLVRFAISSIAPNKEGPRVQGAEFVPTFTTPSSGTVKVSWMSNYDRDNEKLTYQVLRNGVVVATLTGLSSDWKRPTMSWTDTGRTRGTSYSYQLKVTDPFGNSRTGNAVSVTAT